MTQHRRLVPFVGVLLVATALASPRAAASAPAAYPQLPTGLWHWEPSSNVGRFKIKAGKHGKPPTITAITYVTGTERAGCPSAGTPVKVQDAVSLKPYPKLDGTLGYDPWIGAKGYSSSAAYQDYYGLKPVAVKIDVGGVSTDGHVAFQFVKPRDNLPAKKYYGVENIISFGDCFLYPAFAYPGSQ